MSEVIPHVPAFCIHSKKLLLLLVKLSTPLTSGGNWASNFGENTFLN